MTIGRKPFFYLIIAVCILGLCLRLVNIDGRPIHYDEAVHAYVTWESLKTGTYTYQPWVHGPLIYALSAGPFAVFDPSVVLGRRLIAVASVGSILALYPLRRWFRADVLLVVGVLLAFHPMIVWTSRFYRSDMLVITLLLASLGLYARYQDSPTPRRGALLGVALSTAIAAKEITYVLLPVLGLSLILLAHFEWRFDETSTADIRSKYLPRGGLAAGGVGLFAGLILLFGGWPPSPTSAPRAILHGIITWISRSGAGTRDPLYFLTTFVTETPLIFGFVLVGCVTTLLKSDRTPYRWLFLFWLASASVLLSLISHQYLWTRVYILTPMLFVAAFGSSDLAESIRTIWNQTPEVRPDSRAILIALILSGAFVGSAYTLEPNQRLLGVTQEEFTDVNEEVMTEAVALSEDTGCAVTLGPSVNSVWPYQWFLRSTPFEIAESWNDVGSNRLLVTQESAPEEIKRNFVWADLGWYIYESERPCTGSAGA